MYTCRYSVPQMRKFCFFTYPPRSKWTSFEKMSFFFFFFAKIVIFYESIAVPFSEVKTHWIVNWLHLLNQLDSVWRYAKVFMQNFVSMMSPKCSIVENDSELNLMALTHTFCHSSNILGCTQCFWLFMLWFIDEDARFFHFFFFMRKRKYRADGAFPFPKCVRNFLTLSATLPWFSK